MPTITNESKPLVSVIMPCYNATSYLKEAIESIIEQTYKKLEIIVINDGSTDNTLSILKEYTRMDSRLKIINQTSNQGLVSSLNLGIGKATGDYIARMDADDVSILNRIERQINFLQLNPDIDAVSCGFYYIKTNQKHSVSVKPKGTLPLSLKFISLLATPMAHASVMCKSEVFKTFAYDTNFIHSEDYDIFSRMAFSGIRLFNKVEPLYGIRIHEGRVSNLYEEEQIQSHIRISEKNLLAYFGLQLPKHIHSILVNRFTGIVQKQDLLAALDVMQIIKNDYLNRELCGQYEKVEIERFVNEQKADILIQAMKNGPLLSKLKLFSLIPTFLLLILKPGILKYLWIKLSMKF